MKHFLLILGIICLLAVSAIGCNKSSDNQVPTATDQFAEDMAKNSAPEIDKTKEIAPQAMTSTQRAETVAERTPEVSAPAATAEKTATTVADVIEMKHTAAFASHTRGIVMFDHKKHISPAPGGYGLTCGECHHDKNGHPLKLQMGDPVQGCLVCHDKTERPKKPADMSPEEWKTLQLEYFYGAIHSNCIDCHRESNAGPTRCTECHLPPEK